MSHSSPHNKPRKNGKAPDEPLKLAEDQLEESTSELQLADEGEDSPSPRRKPGASRSAREKSEKSAGESMDDSREGTSTGGFETMLGKLVVEAGLVTPDEIELCNNLLKQASSESSGEDQPHTLVDLLLNNEFVTQRQIERVRSEFEAKKSSQRIPGYKIIKRLGAGAMATVFLAKQLSLDRLVAIKVLPRKFSDNQKFIERFYKEGRAAAQLNHPNIVQAYDVGQAGDHHYFVMEYVDGETVYDRVATHKRVSEKEAINIIRQVAEALEHAHGKGFIHRDIKPKNIMISKSGTVKLADLGLARAMSDVEAAKAEAGRAYGTPYYISPEQIRGQVDIGPPADIYGLGATFYHMVTGRVPFEAKNPSAVMHKHLKSELVPPDHLNPRLSAGCAQVIEMMMAKDKKARYQNAADLLVDLKLVARGESPQFASRGMSIPAFAVQDSPKTSPVTQAEAPRPGGSASLTQNPTFMSVLVFLIISVLLNIVLALLLFAD